MPLTEFTRDDLTFDLTDAGSPDRGTVVLLHGFPQHRNSWDAVTPFLVDAGYRVLAPDQRGYSPRARPEGIRPYAIDELAADVAALIGELDAGLVHLVGHDWGAAVAWRLAQRRPDLLRSVTGVSVPPTGAFLAALRSPRQALSSWYMGAFQVPGAAERVLDPATPRGRRFLVSWLVDHTGQSRAAAERDVDALGDRAGLVGGLSWYRAIRLGLGDAGSITTPALFVWSTGDVAVTPTAAKLAGKYVGGAYRSVTLPGVSHWIPDEAPEALATAVLAHLAEHG